MSVVAVERHYSVIAEMADGTSRTIRASGETPSEVYQQVRSMPGVRRVGRVTEVGRSSHDSPAPSAPPERRAGPRHNRSPEAHRAPEARSDVRNPEGPDGGSLNRSLSGPRVVRHAPKSAFDQPFWSMRAPPPRPGMAKPVGKALPARVPAAPAAPAAEVVPAVAEVAVPAPAVEEVEVDTSPVVPNAGREYRIIKSRRRDGLPYLLQRGSWRQHGTKRIFDAGWEKGFAERAQAEKHQAWVLGMEQEAAELEPHGDAADE